MVIITNQLKTNHPVKPPRFYGVAELKYEFICLVSVTPPKSPKIGGLEIIFLPQNPPSLGGFHHTRNQQRRFSGLILSILSLLLLCSPAEAARLEEWGFDVNRKRINLTTSGSVQPRAQLIANPNRLVIDLPGITLGYPSVNRSIAQAGIESIRVGQFDPQTTRLVVELSPGYTLSPNQVQFEGNSDRQWIVSLPDPIYVGESANSSRSLNPTPRDFTPNSQNQIPPESPDRTSATPNTIEVKKVETSADGFFIQTSGGIPAIQLQHSGNGSFVSLELLGTTLSEQLRSHGWQGVNRHGVSRMIFTETPGREPITRISFRVNDSNHDWQAIATHGGITLLANSDRFSADSSRSDRPAIIEAIDLTSNGFQILVRSNRPFTYTTDWQRSSGAYQIRIPSAQLARGVKKPNTDRTAVGRLNIEQENSQTVMLQVQPAAGMRIARVTQPAPQLLSVAIEPYNQSQTISSTNNTGFSPLIQTSPSNSPTHSRAVVVIDPGHGGGDPGALGINGLKEKDIVMSIAQQVAANLQQYGLQTVLTRRDDREIDLEPRVQLAERVNARVFVSIHANSVDLTRPDVNGVETYYYSSGQHLAQTIHNHLLQVPGTQNRGVRQARFYVLRQTSMPAVLVEVGFVTGGQDAARLNNPAYRRQLSAAIARGILQYLQESP